MSLFHPEAMAHMSLFLRFDDAPLASVVLAQSGFFDPSMATSKNKNLPDRQGTAYRRIFSHALSDWQKIAEFLAVELPPRVKNIKAVKKIELVKIENRLAEIWRICGVYKDKKRKLLKQQDSIEHLLKLLNHFSNLDVDLSLLKRDLQFLDVRLGIVPQVYIRRLKEALGIEGYYLSVYLQEGDNAHIIVAGIKELEDGVQALLESASFQILQIPEEFHEHPKIVDANICDKREVLLAKEKELEQQYISLKQEFNQEIIELGKLLTLAKPYALLSSEMLRKDN